MATTPVCRDPARRCPGGRDRLPNRPWPGPPCPPPCPPPCGAPTFCPEACREMPFWPCWNSAEEIERRRPRPACLRCGCCELERQGCFARCCACGWIGFYEDCRPCRLRSCCDNLVWPCRPGEPG